MMLYTKDNNDHYDSKKYVNFISYTVQLMKEHNKSDQRNSFHQRGSHGEKC